MTSPEHIPTITMVGLYFLLASPPLALITGAIDMWLNTFPGWFFVAVVTLTIGTTLAMAGAIS